MPPDKKAILIVDDDPSIQMLLGIYFKKHDYRVVSTGDGVDCVALAREHQPDLILMDCIMPGKDGIEACGDLRRDGVTVPIVMLTSKDREEDKERALKAGATTMLSKPFNPNQLETLIRSLLKP